MMVMAPSKIRATYYPLDMLHMHTSPFVYYWILPSGLIHYTWDSSLYIYIGVSGYNLKKQQQTTTLYSFLSLQCRPG